MKMVSVGSWVVFLVLVMLPQKIWGRQSQNSCVPSSCGKISNISHPFRRKDDPPNCGDSRYEIECVNDVAVLRLSRDGEAEHHVQAINYNNYTIRLVDPNIQEHNCSSIPGHFLYKFNFSDVFTNRFGHDPNHHADVDLYQATQYRSTLTYGLGIALFTEITYMSCKSRVPREDNNNNNSTSCLDLHTYVVMGNIKGRSWKPGCHVKLIGATSGLFQLQQQQSLALGPGISYPDEGDQTPTPNISYSDIHWALAYGFEVSWLHATCHEHNCGSRPCYFNHTDQKVLCGNDYSFGCDHRCWIREVIRSCAAALRPSTTATLFHHPASQYSRPSSQPK